MGEANKRGTKEQRMAAAEPKPKKISAAERDRIVRNATSQAVLHIIGSSIKRFSSIHSTPQTQENTMSDSAI